MLDSDLIRVDNAGLISDTLSTERKNHRTLQMNAVSKGAMMQAKYKRSYDIKIWAYGNHRVRNHYIKDNCSKKRYWQYWYRAAKSIGNPDMVGLSFVMMMLKKVPYDE